MLLQPTIPGRAVTWGDVMADIEARLAALQQLVEAQADELSRMRSEMSRERSGARRWRSPKRVAARRQPMSRRHLLGKAGVAAAAGAVGLVAAGQPAAAGQSDGETFDLGRVNQAFTTTNLHDGRSAAATARVCSSTTLASFDQAAVTGVILAYAGPARPGPRSGVLDPLERGARPGREVRRHRRHLAGRRRGASA